MKNLQPSKDEETIFNRSRLIIGEVSKGPLKPPEVIDCLLMPEARFRHVAEDIGLCRIFRGYENTTVDGWVSLSFINFRMFNLGSYCVTILIESTVGRAYKAIEFFFNSHSECT